MERAGPTSPGDSCTVSWSSRSCTCRVFGLGPEVAYIHGAGDYLLIDPATGARIDEAAVPLHLRKARVTRAGIEANTSICSGMFRVRYPDGWTS